MLKCEAEISTAALARGSQNAREFCHRNLWLSDGPARGRAGSGTRGAEGCGGWGGLDLMDFIMYIWSILKYLCFKTLGNDEKLVAI